MPWGYSANEFDEVYRGVCATREEAIAEGRQELASEVGPGGCFYIQGGAVPHPGTFMPRADTILDWMCEHACDEAGDVAEDFPDVGKEAEAELDALLRAWAERHAKVTFWVAVGEAERIEMKP